MVMKLIREGAKRLGATVSPGVKRGGTRKGGGSKYYKRDRETGRVASVSEKKLTRRGAGAAGAGVAGLAAAGASGKDSDKKKATTKRRTAKNETKSQAAERIRRQKEDFERKKRSRKQADDAAASVKKTRELAKQAAKDPKAQKPAAPGRPPASSVKPPKADKMDTKTKVTKPKPTSKIKVDSPKVTKVTKRPKVTGKGSRDVVSKGPMGERRLANVTREQLKAAGLTTGPQGLRKYLNKFKELGRRPKPSDFKQNKKFDSTRPNVGGGPGILSIKAPKGRKSGYGAFMNQGGIMKRKGMAKGGAMKKKGYKKGGMPMKTVNGMRVPAFAADGEGPNDLMKKRGGGSVKKKGMSKGGVMKKKGMAKGGSMKKKGMAKGGAMTKKGMAKGGAMKKKGYAKGGMTKKGYAKGGMTKKGYAKGGAAMRSKMSAKGGKKGGVRRGKPRGVGAALRGFGKALR